jgi:ankyrin repeat protein
MQNLQEEIEKEIQKEILFDFVRSGNKSEIDLLLSKGVDINITNGSNVTALSIACEANNFEMVEFLLNKGIKFNTISIIGQTPLQAAATRIAHQDGDERILEILLKKYRDTNINLDDKMLQDIDIRLQHGPNYIINYYRKFVKEILDKVIDDTHIYENGEWGIF